MKELKPCPFCGGEKLIIADYRELEGCNNLEEYECIPCYTVCCDFNQDGCGATSGYRQTESEAIEAWNRRAGDE